LPLTCGFSCCVILVLIVSGMLVLVGCGYSFRLLASPFLSVYAVRLYSLIKPPRTSSRLSRALSRSVEVAAQVGCGGRRSRAR
jgi:hypothetical protein